VPQNATILALGDFNGDGKADLATANYSLHSAVSVLLNNGDGTFGAPVSSYPVPLYATRLAVGDFNGDGQLDLAVAQTSFSSDPNAVSILLGHGDGTFAAPVNYPFPGSPSVAAFLAVADINGDGKPDLLVGTSILLGNGDGTFQPPVSVLPPGYSGFLGAVGDFNGDGKPDVVAYSVNAPGTNFDLAVLLGRGDGTFAPPIGINTYGVPLGSLAVADFNGDGRPDLLVGTSILLGNGDGTFGTATTFSTEAVGSLAVADINGDGKPDLIGVNTAGSVSVVFGDGTGRFSSDFSYPVVGRANGAVATGDLTGSGRLSLAVPSIQSGGSQSVSVLLNAPGATTYLEASADRSALGQPVQLTAMVRRDDAPGGPATGSVTFSDGGTVLGAAPLDVAGFAHLTTSAAGVGRRVLVATYGGGTSFPAALGHLGFPGPSTPGVFDPGSGTWYLRNDNSAGPPDAGTFPYGGVGWTPVMGDWNGDGIATVGVVDTTNASGPPCCSFAVWYLRNENSPGAPDASYPYGSPFPSGGTSGGLFLYGMSRWIPVAGDWKGTGHTGIGMFDPSTGTWYLRNEPGPGLPDAGVFQYGGVGWKPVVGDWDGDGTTDIGVVDPNGVWYLRNSATAGAPDYPPFPYGLGSWKPVVGDWDGDGRTGIGVVDPAGVWYLRNGLSAGAPELFPFPYGLGRWVPVAGAYFLPGTPGAPRAVTGPGALAQAVAGSPASPADAGPTAAPPAAPRAATAQSDPTGVPASAGGQQVPAGPSAQPSRPVAARQALLAGRARAAVLDELFAAGLG
jgi:hypothetical protein